MAASNYNDLFGSASQVVPVLMLALVVERPLLSIWVSALRSGRSATDHAFKRAGLFGDRHRSLRVVAQAASGVTTPGGRVVRLGIAMVSSPIVYLWVAVVAEMVSLVALVVPDSLWDSPWGATTHKLAAVLVIGAIGVLLWLLGISATLFLIQAEEHDAATTVETDH